MSTPLSRESLLAAGYREHPASPPRRADAFFQLRVRRSLGTRYFINVFFYVFPDERERWEAELNTYLKDGRYIDLNVHDCQTVEDVGEFFERAFTALGGRDYDEDF